MERHRVVLWSCLFFEFMTRSTAGQSEQLKYIQEADQIFNSVFHKYNERVPPKQTTVPVWIELQVTLIHVNDLDVTEQILESIIDMEVSWKDSRLFWYPLSVSKITVNSSTVWIPDISVLNAVHPVEVVISPDLVVKSSTEIYYNRRLKLKTFCPTNMSSSTHECPVIIGPRVLDNSTQDFNMSAVSFNGMTAYPNHKWDVQSTSVEAKMRSAEFTDLHLGVQLHRTSCCKSDAPAGPVFSEQTDASGVAVTRSSVLVIVSLSLFTMIVGWNL